MTKSELRTGMIVTLRNGENYYVMLNTGLFFKREQDILIHKVGRDMGWMSLSNYREDLTHHSDPDDIFPLTPEEDRMWDIVQVESCNSPCHICTGNHYVITWKRED